VAAFHGMRMLLPILGTLLVPAAAPAGPIYGTILFNDAALKGAAIVVACGDQMVKGATLDDGSYRVTVPEGRCTLTVTSDRFGKASAAVVSSSSAARYSFNVVKGGDGYELRRQ
jgi:hypothetical protein